MTEEKSKQPVIDIDLLISRIHAYEEKNRRPPFYLEMNSSTLRGIGFRLAEGNVDDEDVEMLLGMQVDTCSMLDDGEIEII